MKEKDKTDSSYGNMLVELGTQRKGLKFKMPQTELSFSPVLSSCLGLPFLSKSTSMALVPSGTQDQNQSNFFCMLPCLPANLT